METMTGATHDNFLFWVTMMKDEFMKKYTIMYYLMRHLQMDICKQIETMELGTWCQTEIYRSLGHVTPSILGLVPPFSVYINPF